MHNPVNLITDVSGLRVGNAQDAALRSGVTAIVFDRPAIASVHVPGGAPALRDTALLEPEMTVDAVDAVLLSGGSVYGLDATAGAQAWLRERGRGLAVGGLTVPIVTQAACFDLGNGGDKVWGRYPPYRELGYAACEDAGPTFALGTAGGGYGATTADLLGGLGSASVRLASGVTVGAIVVVNAVGSAVVGGGPHFWASPWEVGNEFGGLGAKAHHDGDDLAIARKDRSARGTTIGLIVTDAILTKVEAKRIAMMAGAGIARALRLPFGPMDGDTIFAAATGSAGQSADLTELGCTAADCLARAIARGVYEAGPAHAKGSLQGWREKFARSKA